jgi:DNA-binding transcriptional ArsR family regulator
MRTENVNPQRVSARKPPLISADQLGTENAAKKTLRKSSRASKTRREYLEQSLSRRQPWLEEGISRRSWERRRKSRIAEDTRPKRSLAPMSEMGKAEHVAKGGADHIIPMQGGKRLLHQQDRELLMRRVHVYCDAQGIGVIDAQAVSRAIRAIELPERFKELDVRDLVKLYRRARERLPPSYDRWIGLIEKWDKAYTPQKARALVDHLIIVLSDRPRRLLDRMFAHLERQVCHSAKKVRRVEEECKRLKSDEWHFPNFRPQTTDTDKERVHAEVARGPKTKKELARKLGKTVSAISNIGLRLRNEGLITSIWCNRQFFWALPSPDRQFIPARKAIVEALRNGPMTVPALARETGKGIPTIKSALQRHLLPDRLIIRTDFGTYALADTAPRYVSKGELIIAELAKGPMTFQMLVQETGITPQSLPQFLEVLRAKRKIIRVRRGMYALPGRAQEYVPTSDLIIYRLAERPMKLGALILHVNKATKIPRARGSIRTVLSGLIRKGRVEQEKPYGKYRLARRSRPAQRIVRARPTV